ncbi:MAG: hypothetical protein HY800_03230, partial [Ignavibacteriales bacterium]|nr:hypothetical protein [Ignavibacteriales bacterium]
DHHTDPQDIRNMGGIGKKMKITFFTFLMYTLAISGVPFTSGFLSKDEILAGTLAFGGITGHYLIPIIGFLVAGLTAFYMFRLVIITFLGEHVEGHRIEHIHESPKTMTIPLIIFAVFSFFAFFSFNPFGASSGWFYHAIERPMSVVPELVRATEIETFEEALHHSHVPAMILSLSVAGLGILVAFATYKWKKINADAIAEKFSGVYKFLLNKWYFDELYGAIVVGGTHAVTSILRWFDNNIIDGMVNGSASWTRAVVFGYTDHAKEQKISASVFLILGGFVSIIVACFVGQWFWVQQAIVTAIVMALLTGGLTFFFFWAGAGRFDLHVVDGLVNGVAYFSGFFGMIFRKLQTGRVQTYIVFVLLGVMILFYVFR